jgi:tetratricopeptide (TPR) repeat protein
MTARQPLTQRLRAVCRSIGRALTLSFGRAPAEEPVARPTELQAGLAEAVRLCDDADGAAAQAMQEDALARYGQARRSIEGPSVPTAPGPLQPLWQRATVGEARSLCLLGRGEDALALLKRAGALWPHDAEILALFAFASAADAQHHPGSAEAARVAMRRLLQQDVPSAALLHFVGDAAMLLRDDSFALTFYRRALAKDPARSSARVVIARLLRQRGDLLAARLELLAALSARPRWVEAMLELSRVSLDALRHADARRLLVDVLTEHPAHREALPLLMEVLVSEERLGDARILVDRVLHRDPEHFAARWFDGVLLSKQSRMSEALARWAGLAQTAGEDPFVLRAREAVAQGCHGDGTLGDAARVA